MGIDRRAPAKRSGRGRPVTRRRNPGASSDRLIALAGLGLGALGILAALLAPRPALIIADVVGPGDC